MKDTFTIDVDSLKRQFRVNVSRMAKGQDKITQLINDALSDKD